MFATDLRRSDTEALERRIDDLKRLCGQLALKDAVLKRRWEAPPRRAYCDDRLRRSRAPGAVGARLSALLGVGHSWYYEQPTTPTRAERDVALRDANERIVLGFPGYGYRRVTKAVAREGWAVNHKRVLRMMRREALLCQLKRRFAADFEPTGPDQLWVADITYVRLPTAFAHFGLYP